MGSLKHLIQIHMPYLASSLSACASFNLSWHLSDALQTIGIVDGSIGHIGSSVGNYFSSGRYFKTVISGNSAQILGIVCIFYAVDLSKAQLPRPETDWLLVGFVAFHFITHLLMSCVTCVSESQSNKRYERRLIKSRFSRPSGFSNSLLCSPFQWLPACDAPYDPKWTCLSRL